MDLLMIIFLLIFLGIILYKIEFGKNVENSFLDKTQSGVIKGICCIIVVLVHIPAVHGNKIQDVIGSFGYICVTIFFLYSAYGLRYSLENKKDYLKHFIKNRLLVIYIPFVIAHIIRAIVIKNNGFDILEIIGIKNLSFVGELIIFYVLFYLIYSIIKDYKKADKLMIVLTFIISIVTYIFNFGWYVECLGFAFGIIVFKLMHKINEVIDKRWLTKIVVLTASSLVLGIIYIKMKNIEVVNYLSKIILGISIISLIIVLLRKVKIYNKVLVFLGKISYEVFLLHTIVITLLQDLNVSSGIYIVTVIGVTIICSYLMNIVDSKIAIKLKNTSIQLKRCVINENSNDRT